jgi:alkanesulfonate monooxygenase SsuD/methylene tetrahydromethanopterin reductase-like flavin-dependent oxidoreductase (luciferase family)
MLSALAAATERVELGTLVTCTAYRNPALLAKMASTVEEISGGRLILGLGAGDYPPEREMFGYPTDHPVSRFEEALKIIVPLLRTGEVDFAGEFYSAPNAMLRPRGPRPSGPPIMIGALANRPRMLRLVAQYADLSSAWVTHRDPRVAIPEIHLAVDEACLAQGRDPQTLARSVAVAIGTGAGWAPSGAITGQPAEVASVLRDLGAAGIGHVQALLFPTDPSGVDFLGQVIELI